MCWQAYVGRDDKYITQTVGFCVVRTGIFRDNISACTGFLKIEDICLAHGEKCFLILPSAFIQ